MQYPAIWHSSLIFYVLTKFLPVRAAINCRRDADFSKLIACKRGSRSRFSDPSGKTNRCCFEVSIAHQRMLTISDIGVGETLNHQMLQGFFASLEAK
jgi:hypothetical protein